MSRGLKKLHRTYVEGAIEGKKPRRTDALNSGSSPIRLIQGQRRGFFGLNFRSRVARKKMGRAFLHRRQFFRVNFQANHADVNQPLGIRRMLCEITIGDRRNEFFAGAGW